MLLDQHPRLPKVVRFPQLHRQAGREGIKRQGGRRTGRREEEKEGEGDGAL